MREPAIIVYENENYEDYYYDELDGCGGIIYKDTDGKIVERVLDRTQVAWYCSHIKDIKRRYRRFILFRYHTEFDLYEFEDYPTDRSGVFKHFNKKYPNNVHDVMW